MVLDLAGIAPAPAHQGTSVLPLALGAEPPGRRAIFMNIQGLRSMRGVLCYPFKLVVDDEGESPALYDLERDPQESEDVAGRHPHVARELADLLESFIAAQRRYHRRGSDVREQRYAPRIPDCPKSSGS
jgi:hypothetical protein